MATLISLPVELQRHIASFVYLPDLGNLVKARLALTRSCIERLQKHRHLIRWLYQYRAGGRYASNPSGIDLLAVNYWFDIRDWKDLLIRLLAEPDLSHYIEHIDFYDVNYSYLRRQHGPGTAHLASYSRNLKVVLTAHERKSILNALKISVHLVASDATYKALESATSLDPASDQYPISFELNWHFCVLLLTFLPQVRRLGFQSEIEIFGRYDHPANRVMSQTFARIVSNAARDPMTSPWPHLYHIDSHDGPHAIVLPLLCLPTMKTAFFNGCLDNPDDTCHMERRWPDCLPMSPLKELSYNSGFEASDDDDFRSEDEFEQLFSRVAEQMRGPCLYTYCHGFQQRAFEIPAKHEGNAAQHQLIESAG